MKLTNRENLLPEGVHLLTVLDCKEQTSKAGNPMVVLDLEERGGERLRDWLVVTPKTEGWVLHKVARILGREDTPDELDFSPAELIGRKVWGDVHHETYDGKTTARVKDYQPFQSAQDTGPDPFAQIAAQAAPAPAPPQNAINDTVPF
jgi:hypothetical protein